MLSDSDRGLAERTRFMKIVDTGQVSVSRIDANFYIELSITNSAKYHAVTKIMGVADPHIKIKRIPKAAQTNYL